MRCPLYRRSFTALRASLQVGSHILAAELLIEFDLSSSAERESSRLSPFPRLKIKDQILFDPKVPFHLPSPFQVISIVFDPPAAINSLSRTMPNTWADLHFGSRTPTYGEYQFIISTIKRIPICLSEPEYDDLMQNSGAKSGPLAWANAIEWKMFSLIDPNGDASAWLLNGYAADLCTACKQLVADRDFGEEDSGDKRQAVWRQGNQLFGETKNEFARYEFVSVRIVSLTEPYSGNSHGPEIKLEVQEESWTSGPSSNGPSRQPVC